MKSFSVRLAIAKEDGAGEDAPSQDALEQDASIHDAAGQDAGQQQQDAAGEESNENAGKTYNFTFVKLES